MMKKVRIGVLGCGYMAQTAHLPCLAMNPAAEVAALCDRRKDVAAGLARRWEIPQVCGSEEELLSLDLDAVYVLTPAQCHLANIAAALKAGKRVFTEKPAAMSAESAAKLAAAAKAAKRGVSVGYMKRRDANIAELLRRMAEGKWGQLLFVRAHAFIGSHWNAAIDELVPVLRASSPGPEPEGGEFDPGPAFLGTPRDAKFYSFENPYYALLDTGCHSVNLLRLLAGREPEVVSASERGGVKLVEFDFGGATGTLEFCVNFQMRRWDEATELYFERASVRILTPPPLDMQSSSVIEIYDEAGALNRRLTLEDNRQWAFRLQTAAFLEKVRSGDDSAADLDEAKADIAVLETIYRKLTGGARS